MSETVDFSDEEFMENSKKSFSLVVMRTRTLSVLLLVIFAAPWLFCGAKSKLKRFISPDSSLVASVLSVEYGGNGNTESKIEFRTATGKLVGAKTFMSKDHEHGLGVVKSAWTLDSKFFVFSTITSGGHQPGRFPTFFFSRLDNKLHVLDKFVGIWITDPEFKLDFPDRVSVIVHDRLQNGEFADTLSHSVHLSELKEK